MKKVKISDGKEFRVGRPGVTRSDEDCLQSIKLSSDEDYARGINKLVFEFSTETSKGIEICYVLPLQESEIFGIFDKDELVAALYYKRDQGELFGHHMMKDFSGVNIGKNAPEMEKYISRIIDLLQNQEYSVCGLEEKDGEFVYDLEELKAKADAISLCKNNAGKACAYSKNYREEIKNREDWKKLNLYDEVKDAVEFVEDKKNEGATIVKFKAPDDLGIFYVRLPLLEKDKACLISAQFSPVKYIISRGEGNDIKLNITNPTRTTLRNNIPCYTHFCKQLLDMINRRKVSNIDAFGLRDCDFMEYITGTKTSDGKQIILDNIEGQLIEATETPDKNPRLEKFVASLIKNNFVRNGSSKLYDLLYRIASNNDQDRLHHNDQKVLQSLRDSGAISIEERTKRSWGQFVIDWFSHIISYFTGNSLGKLMSDCIITIAKEGELNKKLEKLMTVKEEPSKNTQSIQ